MPIIPGPPPVPTMILYYGQSVDEASLINDIQNKVTIQLNVEGVGTIPLSTSAIAENWVRVVFKQDKINYVYETKSGWITDKNIPETYIKPENLSDEVMDVINSAVTAAIELPTGGNSGDVLTRVGSRAEIEWAPPLPEINSDMLGRCLTVVPESQQPPTEGDVKKGEAPNEEVSSVKWGVASIPRQVPIPDASSLNEFLRVKYDERTNEYYYGHGHELPIPTNTESYLGVCEDPKEGSLYWGECNFPETPNIPDPTSSNNGKYLGVVQAGTPQKPYYEWAAVDAPEDNSFVVTITSEIVSEGGVGHVEFSSDKSPSEIKSAADEGKNIIIKRLNSGVYYNYILESSSDNYAYCYAIRRTDYGSGADPDYVAEYNLMIISSDKTVTQQVIKLGSSKNPFFVYTRESNLTDGMTVYKNYALDPFTREELKSIKAGINNVGSGGIKNAYLSVSVAPYRKLPIIGWHAFMDSAANGSYNIRAYVLDTRAGVSADDGGEYPSSNPAIISLNLGSYHAE